MAGERAVSETGAMRVALGVDAIEHIDDSRREKQIEPGRDVIARAERVADLNGLASDDSRETRWRKNVVAQNRGRRAAKWAVGERCSGPFMCDDELVLIATIRRLWTALDARRKRARYP